MRELKVLCVEDRAARLNLLRGKLEEIGYKVAAANSGEEAIEMFREEEFDGVLMESALPDYDSLTVRDEMRRMRPAVPVLLYAGIGRSTPMLLRFFDAYVRNPKSPESVLESMRS
ncbi:MAG TPA: response regulator [Terriglobales bacterium]|jgi:CheY-like chemotaxis protein|nr:response regulator [Terriglobales bacterium]